MRDDTTARERARQATGRDSWADREGPDDAGDGVDVAWDMGEDMDRFLWWLRQNKVALVAATCMFALMAVVMALMVDGSWEVVGDVFADGDKKLTSPFLWAWRVGGMFTWPVFYLLLLRPFERDDVSGTKSTAAVAALAGALYGGFGMWVTNEVAALLLNGVNAWQNLSTATGALLIIDLMSLAYTWGFCAIYAVALGRMTGRQGAGWVLPSMGLTFVGRWIGPLVFMLVMSIISYLLTLLLSLAGEYGGTVFVVLIAIALSTGNFAGQWLAFWKAHDSVLGIMPVPAMAYPGYGTYPAGYPVAQPYPAGTDPMGGQAAYPQGAYPQGYPQGAYPQGASPYPAAGVGSVGYPAQQPMPQQQPMEQFQPQPPTYPAYGAMDAPVTIDVTGNQGDGQQDGRNV